MNDSTFVNFENYFCTPTHQVTDVNPQLQNTDYNEIPPTTIHYINNVTCDMTPLTQTSTSPGDQRHQHQSANLFNFISNTNDSGQDKLEGETSSKRVVAGGSISNCGGITNVVSSGNVFGNIPFVQIHTTDVQPQRTSYGNVFRRNISKQEEIKSEPIKSENSEASKERTNATPTPPRGTSQTQNEHNVADTGTENTHNNNKSSNRVSEEEKSSSLLQIYKCLKCPYISLRETERDDHLNTQHKETNISNENIVRQQINCPGCSNIFYTQNSLQVHLKFDHFMKESDILKLISTFLPATTKSNESLTKSPTEATNNTKNNEPSKEPIRKSRIYLKNVDCLREPNRQPMEQTDNQLRENSSSDQVDPPKTNPIKQKISIKSVDVLREPALLRRDYEMQNSNINNFLNFNTDLLNNNMDLINTNMNLNTTTSNYDFTQNLDNSINKTNINPNNNNNNNSNNDCNINNINTEAEKPRRPKIYVKSVESFNLMPLDSLHSNNNANFLNDHTNSCNNNQVFDSNMVHLPYIFDTNSDSNNLNNNNTNNFLNNHNDLDTFQYINTSNTNTNNNYTIQLENSLFLGTSEELNNQNNEQMEDTALIPDTSTTTTTPTPPSTADVNAIMNKSFPTTQEQRGTLHLRTVDELNLMNKTEVQHLIAPNLDNNNHTNDVLEKVNSSSLNDINLIGEDLYEDESFKFHDLDTQMVNDWPETYEDLADDINCIIADASNENSGEHINYELDNNNQKLCNNNFDIDTPQVSLITIRDIEELTGTANSHVVMHNATEPQQQQQQQDLIVQHEQENHHFVESVNEVMPSQGEELLITEKCNNVAENNLKRELSNATPESNETPKVMETNSNKDSANSSNILNTINQDLPPPPLVPVTNNDNDQIVNSLNKNHIQSLPNSDIPLPPLVPVSPMIKLNTAKSNKPNSPVEKGRIYVANNLMEPPKRPVAVAATSGTSVRGRPFGSNRTRITKLKQTIGSSAEDLFSKCSIKGCAFRFKKPETVEYHRKCHDPSSDSPQAMLCPECKSTEFNNWNTLHTHLWRAHQIDMELYKCELCDFKTPIFSRLVNTHAKIHFDDRNYKCEQCEKAFKNSKQLKNHRRWHRVQAAANGAAIAPKTLPTEIHRCPDCGSTFSQQKTMREHCCKKGESSLKCSICEKLMSSKSSLKLHLLTHSDGEKRYKCQNCDYATNDHNAFRRHRMGHENRKMYECNFCPYKSVQSVAYQKHILQKHPEKADSVIHKCTVCTYSTINRSLLIVHQAKHEKVSTEDLAKSKTSTSEEIPLGVNTEKSVAVNNTEQQKSKIKVKSNLFTTTVTTETVVNINHNNLNLVQLYNVDSGSIT